MKVFFSNSSIPRIATLSWTNVTVYIYLKHWHDWVLLESLCSHPVPTQATTDTSLLHNCPLVTSQATSQSILSDVDFIEMSTREKSGGLTLNTIWPHFIKILIKNLHHSESLFSHRQLPYLRSPPFSTFLQLPPIPGVLSITSVSMSNLALSSSLTCILEVLPLVHQTKYLFEINPCKGMWCEEKPNTFLPHPLKTGVTWG